MWRIVNPAATGQARECRVEAQPGLTANQVLRRLAEIGAVSPSKDLSPADRIKGPGHRQVSAGATPLLDGLNLTFACDNRVLDPAKRLEEDYALRPQDTTLYITSLPAAQPLRVFIVRVESGETNIFEMWAEDKAAELQRQIQHRLHIDQDDLVLVHRGEMLDLEKSFNEQLITSGDTIYLLMRSDEPPLPTGLPAPAGRGFSAGTGEPTGSPR